MRVVFTIVYHPHCFFLQCFNSCTVKAPTVYPICKMGGVSVYYTVNTLMRVGRTVFSLFNIPITLVHLFDTLFI